MKKIIGILVSLAFVLSSAACADSAVSDVQSGISSSSETAVSLPDDSSTETSSAETAVSSEAASSEEEQAEGKVLVVYYSATGSTKAVAETVASVLNADIFEIVPESPYTKEDLNWNNDKSRVSLEHNDESKRDVPLTKSTPDLWEQYDTVYLGYPIWWGIAAWPVDGFVKSNDFTGKTVITFCTSASSGIGSSDRLLKEMAGTGNWTAGKRFSSNASEKEVTDWVGEMTK